MEKKRVKPRRECKQRLRVRNAWIRDEEQGGFPKGHRSEGHTEKVDWGQISENSEGPAGHCSSYYIHTQRAAD